MLAVQSGDTECQVERLAAVEAGVARGLVPVRQVAFRDGLPAADAFGDVVAGELDVEATWVGAERAVHLEEAGDLVQHVIEVPCFLPARRLHGVAVHRVARPDDLGAAGRYRLHQRWQRVAYPACAHPGDQGEPARLAVRVQGCDQRQHILRAGRRADLDRDRVADPARELDVGTTGITGALADPQQVSR